MIRFSDITIGSLVQGTFGLDFVMSNLNAITRQRLVKIPQSLNVWEGDRRQLMPNGLQLVNESNPVEIEEYVLWVNGSEGELRSMNVVEDESSLEAIVGALIEAIEDPKDGSLSSRPKKIVVRDREVFLYLKSIAQALKITLELVPELPVIDLVFEKFQDFRSDPPSLMSPKYGGFLLQKAAQLWGTAPWRFFGDHQILEVELNQWGIGTVYISMLGNLGLEIGILAYRSLESLKTFRSKVGKRDSLEEMEAAFLAQNCLFLNYDFEPVPFPEMIQFINYDDSVEPGFGVLDGVMRPFLNDDETLAFAVILEAIHRFVSKNRSHFIRSQFMRGIFPEFTRRHKIPLPEIFGVTSPVTVKVSTLPKLADELINMYDDDDSDDGDDDLDQCDLRTDFVPPGSLMVTTALAWESIQMIRSTIKHHAPTIAPMAGEALPVMIMCTTAAKAKALVKKIEEIGGLSGIGMCSGEDISGGGTELAILKSRSGILFFINEFSEEDETDKRILGNWLRRSAETNNVCGLIIAKGYKKGQKPRNPKPEDIIALYEMQTFSAEQMGLEKLFQTM